jgi:hypothetical protein
MEDYTYCLRVNAGSGQFDRQAAAQRAEFAKAQCRERREATMNLAIELFAPRLGTENARERVEQLLESMESIFPAVLMAGGGVEIPPAIAPAVRRYLTCLKDQMEERGGLSLTSVEAYGVAIEASITACVAVRIDEVSGSEATLASLPEYRDLAHRRAAIQRAFDEIDAVQRNFLEIMNFVSREQLTNASN